MDLTHVKDLEETVRGGAWGQTTLVRPSVLLEGGKKCTSGEDGRYVLNNGLHAVKALMNVAAELEAADSGGSPDWLNEELAEIFSGGGLLVDVVEYSSPDRSARYAIQALAHEQEQNRYRPATLKNKVDLVSRIYLSMKDWSSVTKQLLDVLGLSKRSTVQRWVTLARDLDADFVTYRLGGDAIRLHPGSKAEAIPVWSPGIRALAMDWSLADPLPGYGTRTREADYGDISVFRHISDHDRINGKAFQAWLTAEMSCAELRDITEPAVDGYWFPWPLLIASVSRLPFLLEGVTKVTTAASA